MIRAYLSIPYKRQKNLQIESITMRTILELRKRGFSPVYTNFKIEGLTFRKNKRGLYRID